MIALSRLLSEKRMKYQISLLIISFLTLRGEPAFARQSWENTTNQHPGCPPGHTPISGPGWHNCAPIPGWEDQTQQAPVAAPPRKVKAQPALAVVWHPAANEVFAASKMTDETSAFSLAFQACETVMGEGCAPADSITGGVIAIGLDDEGNFHSFSDTTERKATKGLLANCKSPDRDCRVHRVFKAKDTFDYAGQKSNIFMPTDVERTRKLFAAGYRPETNPTEAHLRFGLWLATGYRSMAEAESASKSACERDTGQVCTAMVNAADGLIGVYHDKDGLPYTVFGRDTEVLKSKMNPYCSSQKIAPCNLTYSFDVRTRNSFMVQLVK